MEEEKRLEATYIRFLYSAQKNRQYSQPGNYKSVCELEPDNVYLHRKCPGKDQRISGWRKLCPGHIPNWWDTLVGKLAENR